MKLCLGCCFFTDSALWAGSVIESGCPYGKNVPSVDDWNRESWRFLVGERIANIRKLRTLFFWSVLMFICVFNKNKVFGSLQTALLCLVGKLAGGGSLAMADDISEM